MNTKSILDSYRFPTDGYDECFDSSGQMRSAWKNVGRRLGRFSSEELQNRDQLLQKLVAENGITYNVYSEEGGQRQWAMDLLPLVFDRAEWSKIESDLQQRAELINASLVDLYSEQRVLRNAILPPYLVYANPAFLRPCFGMNPHQNRFIHLYAADIARSPDGSWWVLSDRIEAASGMGYVLENRMLSNRTFPEFFRDQQINRLRPFYDNFTKRIQSMAPNGVEGRVALLTPGIANETYFEQSFLSKNLGFELVEGADLTVRENRLYFKNLKGVHPISSLIRRLDSDWCDPLELRNDSLLGVPALIECLRHQNLGMMNALGSGLMETVAFPAFMNNLSRFFLGEDLKSSSVATWWCGQPKELQYVIENLSDLVVKKTFRNRGDQAIFGPGLNRKELDSLVAQIRQCPEEYCAQEIVSRATAPTYIDGKLDPHHFLVRVYLMHTESGYKILPGGLARIAPDSSSSRVSMQEGAMSKDVWVINKETPKRVSRPIAWDSDTFLSPSIEDDISSRSANNFYWFGRYLERIENLSRLIRIIVKALIEDYHEQSFETLLPFLRTLLNEDEFQLILNEEDAEKRLSELDQLLHKYVSDRSFLPSLVSGLDNVRRIAFSVKDRLTTDTWQILSKMDNIAIHKWDRYPDLLHSESIDALEEALDWIAAFSGKAAENMTQSLGWQFLMLGKRVERASNLMTFIQKALSKSTSIEEDCLILMLDFVDSSISYRSKHLNHFEIKAVMNLLLKDKRNPRSLSFSIERIIHHVGLLPWGQNNTTSLLDYPSQQLISQLVEHMSRITPEYVASSPEALEPIGEVLNSIHQSVEQRFFTQTT